MLSLSCPGPPASVNVVSTEKKKKKHNLKVESYVLFSGQNWGHQPWDTTSQITLRDCSGEAREEPGYTGLSAPKTRLLEHQKIMLIEENQTSHVKEFSAFLCMGRCKSLGLLKSFLWYAPQLSGDSILCFLILSSLRVHCRCGCNVMAWRLQHPLFTDIFHPQMITIADVPFWEMALTNVWSKYVQRPALFPQGVSNSVVQFSP